MSDCVDETPDYVENQAFSKPLRHFLHTTLMNVNKCFTTLFRAAAFIKWSLNH